MKILFITTKCPYPPQEGMTLRTYNLITYMSRKAEIHLLTLLQSPSEAAGLEHLRRYCARVEGIPVPAASSRAALAAALVRNLFSSTPFVCDKYDVPEMRRAIRTLLAGERFDALHLDLLPLAVYANEAGALPVVLVEHNIESSLLYRRYQQERNVLLKAFLFVQWLKLKAYERRACPKADRCVVMSDVDRDILLSMAPETRTLVVPNGVDTSYFVPGRERPERDSMVFVGSQAWHPNLDGLRYFIDEIFPLIFKRKPGVKVYLVGKVIKQDLVPATYKNNIIMTGLVDDIRPIVQKASVFFVPLRVGGGTRLKILDALAMGKAIVSTSIGCEGIEAMQGKNIIVADTPEAFAEQTVTLLDSPDLVASLGREARVLAEQKYDWNSIYRVMESAYGPRKQLNIRS